MDQKLWMPQVERGSVEGICRSGGFARSCDQLVSFEEKDEDDGDNPDSPWLSSLSDMIEGGIYTARALSG